MEPSSRGREAARGVVRSSPKPEKSYVFRHRRVIKTFVRCFLHSSAQMCLFQTPGPRSPRITGRVVNTVTRGWVGAPNERAPFTFHGVVVGFVHRCLSTTLNIAASNYQLADFFSGRSWPSICPRFFFGLFLKFGTCFLKISGHSERYTKRMAGIFEIHTCFGNIAFPLSSV